ncbi:S8 family peptidase [Actinoplanes sp. NPDC024001]|uniref:S8 family peptidase n=1 Tax=Actinoplanes sp. NPDC024001 TaxID=3154598 RepID=UPI0033E7C107
MRRLLTGTLAVATAATLGAFALPTGSQAFSPVSYRVVTTTLDASGRPVFSVRETTSPPVSVASRTGAGVEVDVPVRATGSDPYRGEQWDLDAIGVATAWRQSTGAGVTVAVIDTGVDGNHPDLAGQVLTGYDAIRNTAGGNTDANGHGTHVAGTIAAATGNGRGVAGIAPDARILPVKALGADGSGWMSDTAEGIVWATDHGARVINMSLGAHERTQSVTAAIGYARRQGVTVVAAAGNERAKGSPTSYPAADEGVIAVAATGARGEIAPFSNAGSYVDVAAPGSHVLSTVPGDEYALMSGTSMAAPHVAAVAALLLGKDPGLSPDQVEAAIEGSAVDSGPAGFDTDYGHGRIDAAAAFGVERAVEAVQPEISRGAASRSVTYGTRTVTAFTVRAGGDPLANHAVSACFSAAGGSWTCTNARTDGNGAVSLTRTATGAFRARLSVPQTAVTATVDYTVRAVVTASRACKGAITVRISGASGQSMAVQRYVNKRWTTVKKYPATAARKVTGLVSGGSYRVVLANSATVRGVTSGTVKA